MVSYHGRTRFRTATFKVFFTPAARPPRFFPAGFPAGRPGRDVFPQRHPEPIGRGHGESPKRHLCSQWTRRAAWPAGPWSRRKKPCAYCLGRLHRGDRFNVIRFATEAEAFFPGLTAATPANLARAKEFVANWQAAGGTNFEEALKLALDEGMTAGRPRLIVLVTDGKPTIGETGDEALLRLVAAGPAPGRCASSRSPSAATSTPTCWTGWPSRPGPSAPISPPARRSRAASPASTTRSARRS